MQKGQISVQTENIFPIIKQFLYSDQEIFLRELIANATDASAKLKAIAARGELNGELGDLTIDILLDAEAKTLTIRDRGIGMTEEEVLKYLNQVAFSSAQEFLDKYKDESIIGHFGLGFYSAFMVADTVEVRTKSYTGGPAVRWVCAGDPSYEMETIEKTERGTDIILHISEDSVEYLEKDRIEELLNTYCRFLPIPIRFGQRTETSFEGEGEDRKSIEKEVDNIINTVDPIWKKSPADLSDEDYKQFYQTLHPYSSEPLFWIHLNIDYPFNLTGVLYFPKLGNSIEMQRNKISLYSNQVYVTDDVSAIVPEFLTLLHGVIDSPDIPLNVSRSYLQSDREVKKITSYITKKVADKLTELFKEDRTEYEQKWQDIGLFVKYGLLSDDKFYERAIDLLLYERVDGTFQTHAEHRAAIVDTQTDKHDAVIHLYSHDPAVHHPAILRAEERGYQVIRMDQMIDTHLMQQLEMKLDKVRFKRIDADTLDRLIERDESIDSILSDKELEKVKGLMSQVIQLPDHQLKYEAMSPSEPPIMITRPEFMRRMAEMQMMGRGDNMPDHYEAIVNTNHPLISDKLLKMRSEDKKTALVQQVYDLARLQQGMLTGDELAQFVQRSLDIATL